MVEVNLTANIWHWVLLAQDVFELVGSADGEQQCPGQQSIGVELACLGIDRRTGAIRPSVGPGEQVLKALHGSMHVLKQEVAGIMWRLAFAMQNILKRLELFEEKKFQHQSSQIRLSNCMSQIWVQIAACPPAQRCQTTKETPKVIKNLPKCHLLQLKYRGLDLLPPIRETDLFSWLSTVYKHKHFRKIQTTTQQQVQWLLFRNLSI